MVLYMNGESEATSLASRSTRLSAQARSHQRHTLKSRVLGVGPVLRTEQQRRLRSQIVKHVALGTVFLVSLQAAHMRQRRQKLLSYLQHQRPPETIELSAASTATRNG
jgi:hypothetical protein